MAVRYVKSDVVAVGAIDWDRKLFDMLIPLPHGTSYNSYVVIGSEKTAIIDTSYLAKAQELITNLKTLNIKKLDYIIANHGEPDHTGAIPQVLEMFPEATIVTNAKCKDLLLTTVAVRPDKVKVIEDMETLSLGNKTLQFIIAPWVHWPDTMFTFLQEDKILFTCDFMGSHLATSDLFVKSKSEVYEPAKRYYAEIMMPFRSHIKKHLAKMDTLDFEIIAPSHGPIYGNPQFIVDAYKDWISDTPKNQVMIPYISMYESTEKMVKYLIDRLIEKGIKVKPFNLAHADLGELAIALVDTATVVFGASMVLSGPHPNAVYAAYLINSLRPKAKYMSAVGSYGWAGPVGEKMNEQLQEYMPIVKTEMIPPVFVKGAPTEETYRRLDKLAEDIHEKHSQLLKPKEAVV